jgi:hypothetical protein
MPNDQYITYTVPQLAMYASVLGALIACLALFGIMRQIVLARRQIELAENQLRLATDELEAVRDDLRISRELASIKADLRLRFRNLDSWTIKASQSGNFKVPLTVFNAGKRSSESVLVTIFFPAKTAAPPSKVVGVIAGPPRLVGDGESLGAVPVTINDCGYYSLARQYQKLFVPKYHTSIGEVEFVTDRLVNQIEVLWQISAADGEFPNDQEYGRLIVRFEF